MRNQLCDDKRNVLRAQASHCGLSREDLGLDTTAGTSLGDECLKDQRRSSRNQERVYLILPRLLFALWELETRTG